jgi:P-type conjugative transfer protein TrbG
MIQPVDGRVLVKPKAANVTTNLIVLTARHTYHLTLKSGGKYMPRVAFYYPQEIIAAEATRKGALEHRAREASTPAPVAKLNFDYTVSGPNVPWKPVQTFDDGERVYIEMPQTLMASDAPTLMINADGADTLVNYQVKGRYYIVDRLFKQAVLVSLPAQLLVSHVRIGASGECCDFPRGVRGSIRWTSRAEQRPISPACITVPVNRPLWKDRSIWFLIAEQDRMHRPEHAALHGGADARPCAIASGRPRANRYRGRRRGRNHTRGHRRSAQRLIAFVFIRPEHPYKARKDPWSLLWRWANG